MVIISVFKLLTSKILSRMETNPVHFVMSPNYPGDLNYI